jgi:hypothetical protein
MVTMNKKMSEISLSHSSSRLSSGSNSQQEKKIISRNTSSSLEDASLTKVFSKTTTPRMDKSDSKKRDSLIERDLSIEKSSS